MATIGLAQARLHSVLRPKHPLALDDLAAFRAIMRPLRRPSVELLRELQEEAR